MSDPSAAVPPTPVLPAFDGPCLANVVPALLARADADGSALPDWVPAPVSHARQLVLLVLDGLGWEQLEARSSHGADPVRGRSAARSPRWPRAPRPPPSPASPPGCRRPSTGSSATGCGPTTRCSTCCRGGPGPATPASGCPPRRFQPYPPFPRPARGAHPGGLAVGLRRHRLHRRAPGRQPSCAAGTPPRGWRSRCGGCSSGGSGSSTPTTTGSTGWRTPAGWASTTRPSCGRRTAWWPTSLAVLPPGAVLVVTADHGQVEVGSSVEVLGAEMMDGVVLLSGEGRFRWLHARPGAAEDVAAAAAEAYGHVAWVRTREEIVDEGWLGGEPVPGGGRAAGRRRPGPVRPDRLPRPGRHRRAAPGGPARLAHRRRDAGARCSPVEPPG